MIVEHNDKIIHEDLRYKGKPQSKDPIVLMDYYQWVLESSRRELKTRCTRRRMQDLRVQVDIAKVEIKKLQRKLNLQS